MTVAIQIRDRHSVFTIARRIVRHCLESAIAIPELHPNRVFAANHHIRFAILVDVGDGETAGIDGGWGRQGWLKTTVAVT